MTEPPPQGPPPTDPPRPAWGAPPPARPQQWQPPVPAPVVPAPVPDTEWLPEQPRRHRGRLVGAAAAVIVLAGGGVATYVAFSDSSGGGAASPRQAVQKLVTDLQNSDYLGMLSDLAPGERSALADPVKNQISQLKRLKVLNPNADPSHVDAVKIRTSNLTFSPTDVRINDHVSVVQVTGGTLSIDTDAAKLPFSRAFLDAMFPHGTGLPPSIHKTIDIGKEIAQHGGTPLRIATQQVDGAWYPSLFYTIADNAAHAAHVNAPSAAERIPNRGAATPEQALRDLIDALASENVERAIELASPDELAALHDYGALLVKQVHGSGSAAFTIKDLQLRRTDISGGVRLTLKSLAVTTSSGADFSLAVSGNCVNISAQGNTRRFCSADVLKLIPQSVQLSAAQRTALEHLLQGVLEVGVDLSQSGGAWYVDGMRTYFDLSGELFSHLQGDDAITLLRLVAGLR